MCEEQQCRYMEVFRLYLFLKLYLFTVLVVFVLGCSHSQLLQRDPLAFGWSLLQV